MVLGQFLVLDVFKDKSLNVNTYLTALYINKNKTGCLD
jgi:hypothetical protein